MSSAISRTYYASADVDQKGANASKTGHARRAQTAASAGASPCPSDTFESREARRCPVCTAAFLVVRAHLFDPTRNLGLCVRVGACEKGGSANGNNNIHDNGFNASILDPLSNAGSQFSFEERNTTYAASMALHEARHHHLRRHHHCHYHHRRRHHHHRHHQLVSAVVLVRQWIYAPSAPERP